LKAIHKLLQALDSAWVEPDLRGDLIREIRACLNWMPAAEISSELAAFKEQDNDLQVIRKALTEYLSRLKPMVKDSQIPLREGDGLRTTAPELLARGQQIVVILDNLRSIFNVGSIFRSSECLALRELVLCGITPDPTQERMAKTAMGTTERVNWSCFPETIDAISHYRKKGYRIVALETAQEAISVFEYRAPLPLALVLGNESLGISEDVLALCDDFIALPVLGWKNSLNVGVAFAVTAYQIVMSDE